MTATDLRAAILTQIETLGISRAEAARLADVNEQTARDYLAGRQDDISVERVLQLAAAVGLKVSVTVQKKRTSGKKKPA